MVKKIFKSIVYFFLIIIFYVLVMFLMSHIQVNSKSNTTFNDETVSIYINSNGVHTDLVVPYVNQIKDWSKIIPAINAKNQNVNCNFLAIGWGDKGFYLEIEEWADLDIKTAFNAAFGLSDSAMHATFLTKLSENEQCKEIKISVADYKILINYIEQKFEKDKNGNFIIIPNESYFSNDVFYEANGQYSFYYTCNSWANEGLKLANQKAALWTLHEGGIYYHYK